MNEELISKTTFSEVYKIMNHKDGEIRKCIKPIIDLACCFYRDWRLQHLKLVNPCPII